MFPKFLKPYTLLTQSAAVRNYSAKPIVIVEKIKNITTIGINRPEVRNCISLETAHQLNDAFNSFENDPQSLVAVLYGVGGYFCAGLDLKEISGFGTRIDSINYDPHNSIGVGPMGPSRRMFSKPTIAAISGYAVAGGMEIALACDLRVIEETAVMGIFCRRFGVPLIDGGTVRLPALIGLSRALDLILTGREVKGKEAYEIGLANRLVSPGTSLSSAVELAQSLTIFPQECMKRDRASAYNSTFSAKDFQSALEYEMENGNKVLQKESIKGASRFANGVGRHGSFKSGL